MTGTGKDTFSPTVGLTREELAVILANYARKMNYTLPVLQEAITFTDSAQISPQAKADVKALQQAGILTGKDRKRFDTKGKATRAEVAVFLSRRDDGSEYDDRRVFDWLGWDSEVEFFGLRKTGRNSRLSNKAGIIPENLLK